MTDQEHPKLKVRDIEKMTEEQAHEELEKRGLLYDEMPEGSEITMTIEEMEDENSGFEDITYKDMLIESVVIDENGVFIGEQAELDGLNEKKESEKSITADDRKKATMVLAINPKTGKLERLDIGEEIEFEIPQFVNRNIRPPSQEKDNKTIKEIRDYI